MFENMTGLRRLMLLNSTDSGEAWHEITGSLLTFTTKRARPLSSCVLTLTPKQSGSGDPYPGGGGKNQYKDTFDGWTKPNNYWIYPVTLSEGTWTLKATLRSGKTAVTGCVLGMARGGTDYASFVEQLTCVATDGAGRFGSRTIQSGDSPVLIYYGTEANFNAIIDAYEVQLESGSTATAYSPYSNIRPISGVTGDAVVVTGVNVWDEEWELGRYDTATGASVIATDRIRCKNRIRVNANTDYRFVGTDYVVYWYDKFDNYISYSTPDAGDVRTSPSRAYYMRFNAYSAYGTTYNHDISINYPSTDTSYHPGTANAVYPLTIPTPPGTVYGGEIDAVNGTITVTKIAVNPNDWTYYNQSNGFKAYKITDLPYGKFANYISNEPISNMINEFGSFSSSNMTKNIIQTPSLSSNIAYLALQSDLDPKDVQLVYLIKEPVTYSITPQQIETLSGVNHVWAEDGELTVKYWGF